MRGRFERVELVLIGSLVIGSFGWVVVSTVRWLLSGSCSE